MDPQYVSFAALVNTIILVVCHPAVYAKEDIIPLTLEILFA
jgi:hypothetical protein